MKQQTPSSEPLRAAIYLRISRDRKGTELGVQRQRELCIDMAERQGWRVVEIYCENNVSAFSGKPRPEYQAMVESAKRGELDVIVAWNLDRLYRRPVELEPYIDLVDATGIKTATIVAGDFDLNTPAGRAMARVAVAFASMEVETTRERVRAQKLQQAKAGGFSGGQRPWGYTKDCSAIVEDEAVVYKDMVNRMLNGDSFNRIAISLNERGITTQHGNQWRGINVRNLLLHARYAGLREHNGQQYPAKWPAIIDVETWQDLQVAIRAHALRYKQGGPGRLRKFLLSGTIYCGLCGKRLNTVPDGVRNGKKVSRYVCRKIDAGNGPGCGKIARLVDPVDLLIGEAIIYRLESKTFDRAVARHERSTDELRDLMRKQTSQQARVDEIKNDYANGEIAKSDYQTLVQAAQARLDELSRQVQLASPTIVPGRLPEGHRAREVWEKADIHQRRQIIDLLIEHVDLMPSDTRGIQKGQYFYGYKFRPQDVAIKWRR